MTRSVRRTLAAATATAALLALGACGDDDTGEAADKAGASASSSTSDEPADDAGESGDADSGGDAAEGESISGDEFAGLLQSALDDATTAHLTMNIGSMGSGEGDVDYSSTPPEMAMKLTMDQLGGEIEVRMVDNTMYMKGAAMGGGDGWVSIPLDDPNSPLGDIGSQLNPTQQFEAFAGAVTEATLVGEEDVDGETFDHYTATIDTAELTAASPQAGAAGTLPDSLEQDWWFDEDGMIRKFSSDFGSATGAVELSLDDWGDDVEIEAPPADEVTPLGDLSGQMGSGGA